MEYTTKRKIAAEVVIIAGIIIIAYVLATLFSNDVFSGMDAIRVQGIGHYLHHRLFGGIEYGYFFKAIVILYCFRLTIWAVAILVKKQQTTSI